LFCCWKQRFVVRDGQSIEIDDPLKTYYGKRGTFTLRIVVEWVDAQRLRHRLRPGTRAAADSQSYRLRPAVPT
jgi:hypothetical protein